MPPRLFHSTSRFELTDRQDEVIRLIARGKTNAEIADELGISLDGAKYHVREILGKLGVESREQAVATWREEQHPAVRAARWAGAVTGIGWPRFAALAAGGAALVALAVVVSIVASSGDDDPVPLAVATAAATTVLAPTIPASTEISLCDPEDIEYSLEPRVGDRTTVDYLVLAELTGEPCRLVDAISISILDSNGTMLDINANGMAISFDAELPTNKPLIGAYWRNWCAASLETTVRLTTSTGIWEFPRTDVPNCDNSEVYSSQLNPFSTEFPPPRPTPEPLPAGLERANPPKDIRVWIYKDAEPTSNRCIDLLEVMVPVAAAGKVAARPFECTIDKGGVYFAVDPTGQYYLLGVAVLPMAKVTLPQPWAGDGTCDSIRDHLVRVADPDSSITWYSYCEAQPLPRGMTSSDSIVIHARIDRFYYGDGELPPDSTPCWKLVRYFKAQSESTQPIEVACTLD